MPTKLLKKLERAIAREDKKSEPKEIGFGCGGITEDDGLMTFYRIQSSKEHPDALFNERRPDGWVDPESENYETQPRGVSACSSLPDLRGYIDTYSMFPKKGDRLLELYGGFSPEEDADQFAVRVLVAGWCDIGDAAAFEKLTREYTKRELEKNPDVLDEVLTEIRKG